MPDMEKIIHNSKRKAWQLQRLFDRMAIPNAKPEERGYESAEDNVDDIIDWFAEKEKELLEIFKIYSVIKIRH